MKKCIFSLFVMGLVLALCAPSQATDRERSQGAVFTGAPDDVTAGFQPTGASIAPPSCGAPYSCSTTMGVGCAGAVLWTAPNRLFRDGVASTCPTGKVYPGNLTGGPWYYQRYDWNSVTQDRCYTINHNGGTCGGGYDSHDAVFCGTYPATGGSLPAGAPGAPNAFKGDTGGSPAANQIVPHQVCIPANVNWSLLFTNVYSMNNCSFGFTLDCSTSTGVPCTSDPNCSGGPPPAGGGGTGGGVGGGTGGGVTCNLAPIEAKLDVMEAKMDNGVGADWCELYVLLNPRLPGKPDAAGSKCLGLIP